MIRPILGCLACFLALLFGSNAKADIILSYHLSSFVGPGTANIPSNLPLGPQLSNLTITIGETRYIQIAIEANSAAPFFPSQTNWNSGNGMISFGFALNYPTSIVSQPFVAPMPPLLNQNFPNARSQSPFATGHPNTFPNYNIGATAITGLDLGSGIVASAGILPKTVLATLKITGSAEGMGSLTISELNPSPTAAEFGLLDLTNLDPIVFAAAHQGFPLPVVVVPEPSSICLVGCALACFGTKWRNRGRKSETSI